VHLSDELNERGFCVVHGAAPPELINDACQSVLSRLGGSLDDALTWGPMGEKCGRGFAPIWNDQSLWNIRQCPRIFATFSHLLRDDDLWVTIDRCHFKPPIGFRGVSTSTALARIAHWDEPDARWPDMPLQGVLALVDTPPDRGSFVCSPTLFRTYLREGRTAAQSRIESGDYDLLCVGSLAGDLIIWDRRLFHGNGPNFSTAPRIAFYLSMHPPGTATELERRVVAWRSGDWLYGPTRDYGFDRADHTKAPNLTPLGRKLLGIPV